MFSLFTCGYDMINLNVDYSTNEWMDSHHNITTSDKSQNVRVSHYVHFITGPTEMKCAPFIFLLNNFSKYILVTDDHSPLTLPANCIC